LPGQQQDSRTDVVVAADQRANKSAAALCAAASELLEVDCTLAAFATLHPLVVLTMFTSMLGPGVYVWGKDWIQAKTQAECYDYLFEAAVKMAQLGINASVAPPPTLITANGAAVPEGKRHAENGGHIGEDGFAVAACCAMLPAPQLLGNL
jgi:hypothetical protein